MKEKILEILRTRISAYQMVNDDDPIEITGIEASAEDITKLSFDFIHWCIINTYYEYRKIRYGVLDAEKTFYTLEELFTYWHTNIYKK
jgi:hypothetical protein